MSRMFLAFCMLAGALLAVPASADDPPKKLTPEERKELLAKWDKLIDTGIEASQKGRYPEAEKAFRTALEIARKLYPKTEFPDGHVNLATSLNNLGLVYRAQGKLADTEPLYKAALEMKKRLFKVDHPSVATSLNNLAFLFNLQGKYAEAESLYKDALEMRKRLFKDDHPSVADSLNNLAFLYHDLGKLVDAELLYKEAMAIYKRLFKDDHPRLATSLNNLAILYRDQGKLADAESLLKDALEMTKRLFKDDHPDVATSLNNMAFLYRAQGKLAEAEPLYKEALEMTKRLFKKDHLDIASGLNNLAFLYQARGKLADAEPLFKDALEMTRRLFKGDHPHVAKSLNNLASLYQDRGKLADAGPLYKEAVAMDKRLFQGDHPDCANSLGNLAMFYLAQQMPADAKPLVRDALAMSRRLSLVFAQQKAIGPALTLIASQPRYRDGFLSITWTNEMNSGEAYSELWIDKGFISRVYEWRQQQARAAATDPQAAKLLADLISARQRRAELLLAPLTQDPVTLKRREQEIQLYENQIEELTRAIRPLLPTVERAEKLAASQPSDLQKVLPADTVLIDFVRFTHFEYGKAGEKRTPRYLAFVVSKEKIGWVILNDTAEEIDQAVKSWREAITQRKKVPADIPTRVRELVWEKISKELPASIKTLYICPDSALCRLPWAALPGDKPDTILLEQYAIATIPHAPFLLDKLWPQEPRKNPRAGVLAIGGVKYDAELAPVAASAVVRSSPLVKSGALVKWDPLDYTRGEAEGFTRVARKKNLPTTTLTEEQATSEAVLTALPKARYAHLATHGFFADPSFRFVFNLNETDFANRFGERIGRAANSPLVMSGLVFAGANNPKTPSYGILTGEALIDLDLSGLELAVLSACETGVGDVAGGEGTFSLQRAFHDAGAHNVVASLWKTPDRSTAALMGRFYHYLWVKNLSAMESLRQAQLDIYRNPDKIVDWAKEFGGPSAASEDEAEGPKPVAGGKSHPKKWAAFTLSGAGR